MLLGLVGLWLSLGASVSRAQIIEAWSLGTGFDPRPSLPRARLEAMGGMMVAVPDENNEINLLDFAGNLVGHIDDKPTSHIDAYGGWRGWVDRTTPEDPDQDFRYYPMGFQANAIPNPRYALGGSMAYTSSSAERLVSAEFLRTFGMPVVNPESGSNLDTEIGADMSGGDFTVHYARRLADRFAFGLLGGYSLESENRTSPNIYRIDHDSHVWSAKASLAGHIFEEAGPFQNWSVGANGLLASTRIDGLSADDLHTDEYTWERNPWGFNVHLLGQVMSWIKGGLDFRYGSFEGVESAEYNWSPQFSLNPTTQPIVLERSVFDEGLRSQSFITRWEGQPPGLPASFGLGFRAGQGEYWVLPSSNVNSSVVARNQRVTDWELSGGGSYFLPKGRGLVAGEMTWGFLDRDESVTPPTQTVGASAWALGAGGEYAVTLPIVARAGYRLILEDQDRDRDNPEGEFTTHRLALGAGYRTPGAKILIDFAFNYEWKSSAAEEEGVSDEVVEDQDRKAVTLQLRTLF